MSPAPRITPDKHWVTAMATYPSANIRIICMLKSTNSLVSVKIDMRYFPKVKIIMVITAEVLTAIIVPCLVPSSTLSSFLAPIFYPVYVVIALPKVKFGIMANASTLMRMTLAAMTISPKVLVRD